MTYYLEIYESGSFDDVLVSYQSETPFGAISRGDLLSLMLEGYAPNYVLEVVQIEHFIFGSVPHHKMMVYTRKHENLREVRQKLIEQV
ncbi:hypothetical protein [Reyranella sp. CPCC 100927]|uniref:hypothetical protein n=1 Tax=Reyranella sp. CPCC 100927 TaxID=2599616 RepID=UPI0011B35BF0|nr:hypothetical protein [Reyranella sp. CPCC 100927]TWT10639.1 hypothetical protein FQU96_16095 [Reyranella sp. CPCC 100927]